MVPACILLELLAQTGGLAAGSTIESRTPVQLRVAAVGPCKFPSAARSGALLEASARVVGQLGPLFKVDGTVTADGVVVATGGVTLARVGE